MTTPRAPIFPPLSRTFKSRPYLPNNNDNDRKRKRSDGGGARSFEVRPTTNGHVGVFATRRIACGDLIIENEDPIVHRRYSRSATGRPNCKPDACDACAAPIGSLRANHLMAPRDITLPHLDDDDKTAEGLVFTTSHVTCRGCEKVAWCSDECYQKGRPQHAIFCSGSSSALEAFCGAQDNPTIFHLATQSVLLILSQMASLLERERTPIEQFYWWKDYGSHPLWWEVGGSGRDTKKDLVKEYSRVLQETLLESVRQKRVELDKMSIIQICKWENVGSILGMLQCNVMQYECPSPTQQYMAAVEEILELMGEADQGDVAEKSALDEEGEGEEERHSNALKAGCDWLLANVHNKTMEENNSALSGSGLYPLLTLANHNCNPNASIEFLRESNRGTMVATRDIAAGEEVCITYVPNGGMGGGDSCGYFRHFEPTRTWKWLNSGNDDDENDDRSAELSSDNNGEMDNEESNLDDRFVEEVVDEDDDEVQSLEGSNQKERAKALLEYGFECQCKRCLKDQNKGKS